MRYSPLIAAAGLLASGLAFGQQAEAAAPAPAADEAAARTCTVYPPRSIAIAINSRTIDIPIGSDCEQAPNPKIFARWDLHSARGNYDHFSYGPGVRKLGWQIDDEEMPFGYTTWTPAEAYDDNGGAFVQNRPTTLIKVASWAGISATRNGSKVTLSGAGARYSANANKLIPWTNTYAQLQYKNRGTNTWRALYGANSNRVGRIGVTVTAPAARDYRVVFRQTNLIWTATSSQITR